MNAFEQDTLREDDILRIENAAVHYGGIKALDGVSFSVPRKKIVGIVGPNGSGKSTLVGALTRLVPLTTGRITLNGRDYGRTPPHALAGMGVARTFQTVRLLPELTVAENVALGTDVLPFAERRSRANTLQREAIERVGLTGAERARPDALPYGLQRRVEIARALASQPALLLLDEPTAGMNRSERREVSVLLKALREEGLSQLLVEHDIAMMIETCDILVAMNFGKIITIGAPDEVVNHPEVRAAYLGKRAAKNA